MTTELRAQIEEMMIEEYWLLDDNRFEDWLALMTDDIHYWAPVRENLGRDEEDFYQPHLMMHFDDDRATMGLRVARLRTGYAHAEEPPSRRRHFVSNVKILDASSPENVRVASNFIIFRSRTGLEEHLFVGSRRDQWVQTPDGWRLCERMILFDHDIIENITVFV